MWAELKMDDSKFPPIDAMHKAVLWTSPELYRQSVWSWLLDESVPAITTASALSTQVGSVCNVMVKMDSREEKLVIGSLGPVHSFICSIDMFMQLVCKMCISHPTTTQIIMPPVDDVAVACIM